MISTLPNNSFDFLPKIHIPKIPSQNIFSKKSKKKNNGTLTRTRTRTQKGEIQMRVQHKILDHNPWKYFSDAITEVWELVDKNNAVINPSLPHYHYYYGVALFPVNVDFCKKWIEFKL